MISKKDKTWVLDSVPEYSRTHKPQLWEINGQLSLILDCLTIWHGRQVRQVRQVRHVSQVSK